jgi:hypothetical protein
MSTQNRESFDTEAAMRRAAVLNRDPAALAAAPHISRSALDRADPAERVRLIALVRQGEAILVG